jgi:diguanylate cyclase (GGDEF)-like protein
MFAAKLERIFMIWITYEALLLIISAIVTLGLFVSVLRFPTAPGALPFAVLMLCAFIWSLGYALEIASPELLRKLFWLNVQQIGIFGSPIAWLLLALRVCGKDKWLNKRLLIPVSLIPIMAVLLIWTNDWHHLMRLDTHVVRSGHLVVVQTERTQLSYFFIGYAYLLLLASLALFIQAYKRASSIHKGQYLIYMISLLVPLTTNVTDMLGLNPFAPFGPTAVSFIFSGLLIVWGFYRYQLFQIWPIARDKLVDELEDGIIVTDASGIITDLNQSSRHLLSQASDHDGPPHLIGQPLTSLIRKWPEWMKAYTSSASLHQLEVMLDSNRFVEVKISRLKNRRGAFIGHLTVLHDITRRKHIEKTLIKQATTDYLTGIHNRRHFLELSEQQFQIAVRYKKPISLIMIDIDYFKQINDTYGHGAGDIVLIQFVNICISILRRADIFGRMGGEEFAITLPETTLDGAKVVGEKIRQAIEKASFPLDDGQTISFTISAGVVSKLDSDHSFESLLQRADHLLYRAKSKRNCVQVQ